MVFSYQDFSQKASELVTDLHRAKQTHFTELQNAKITAQPNRTCADIKIVVTPVLQDKLRIKPTSENGLEVILIRNGQDTGFNCPLQDFSPTIYKMWFKRT